MIVLINGQLQILQLFLNKVPLSHVFLDLGLGWRRCLFWLETASIFLLLGVDDDGSFLRAKIVQVKTVLFG